MQNKGFISVIAGLLILICGFYISFSFVTGHYTNKAKEFAMSKAKTDDVTNEVYKQSLKIFNDSIDKEKVYLGYTYNQVRKMEIGLGLDLKGGMNVVLEISVPDILRQLAVDGQEEKVNEAIAKALEEGYSVERIEELTKIDPWFLNCLKNISDFTLVLKKYNRIEELPADVLAEAKRLGFSDFQIARYVENPDGNYVVCIVAKNVPNKRQTLQIKYRGEYMLVSLPFNTWSMTTILIEK